MNNTEEFDIVKYAQNSIINKELSKKSYSSKFKMGKSDISKFLKQPDKFYKELQETSEFLYTSNGIYYQLINYMATLSPFYGNVYPKCLENLEKKNKKKKLKDYHKICLYLDKLNLKYYLPQITLSLFRKGEIYLYELEDDKGFLFLELPTDICRVESYQNSGGGVVCRYAIDLSKLNDNSVSSLPLEIRIAYERYKNSKDKNNWYKVSNKGVAFGLQPNKEHSIPPYAFLFEDIIDLDNVKDLAKRTDSLDALKMLHFQVPIDKTNGKPLLDIKLSNEYVGLMKNEAPEGTMIMANPFEPTSLTFANTNVQQKDLEKNAINSIYQNAGISDMLFRNDNSSAEALKRSIIVDTQFIYNHILPIYENYINYKLTQLKSIGEWGYYLLRVSYHNLDDTRKEAFNNLPKGGSRTEAQVLTGKTPLQTVELMKFEQDIGIDEIMKPQLTGNVMSGKDEGKGRPKSEEVSDNTEKANESQ